MGKLTRTAWRHALTLFLLAAVKAATARSLRYNSASNSDLVSDGVVHDHAQVGNHQSSALRLLPAPGEGKEDCYSYSSEEYCEQLYGFLPCAYSSGGHLFLIVVYEYLLFRGECFVAAGGHRIFNLLGPGIFGESAFHVLGFLPEAILLLASGLLESKKKAQEYVYTGVGLLAGSTILLLTFLWGTCVILADQEFSNKSKFNPSNKSSTHAQKLFGRLSSISTGRGITTDLKTSQIARVMVLSVIPLAIIQITSVFNLPSDGERVVIVLTLTISALFLLSYFFYQMFQPWIQKRRLGYVKHEELAVDIVKHVVTHAIGSLLTKDGAPNIPAIKRLLEEVDEGGDKLLTVDELKKLLQDVKHKRWHANRDAVIAGVMREFGINYDGNQKINMDEFVKLYGFTKWLDEAKRTLNDQYHSVKSLKDLYAILQPWIQKKKKERESTNQLISEILGHVQSTAIGSLFARDGTPDIPTIRRLFEEMDLDKDDSISKAELKALVVDINLCNVPFDTAGAVEKLMEELDLNGDQTINEVEFIGGFSKWLNDANNQTPPSPESQEEEMHQKKWEEIDALVEERSFYVSLWAWTKAISLLVVGIAVLGILAEPLVESVQSLSKSASVPSFFIAFILVPLATNARNAISAITAACRKKPGTTSLTFSELYGAVFMNNIIGFSVLLSLVYFRELTWDFSEEVLVVLIVCSVVGVAASFNFTFPLWTAGVAYLLYPLSLILIFVI